MMFPRLLLLAVLLSASLASAQKEKLTVPGPGRLDPNQIINESYNLLKNREPDMTAAEYAIYQKVIPMVSEQPEFALVLLETMQDDDEPSSAAFKLVLGNVYFSQDRFEEAETLYQQAVAEFPDFLRAWQNLGVLYYSQDNFEKAVDSLSEALALGDRDPRTVGLMAYCLKQTGNVIAAEAAYMQALAAAPNESEWLGGLMEIYLQSRQFARAEALARKRLSNQPAENRNWMLLASILKSQERDEEAIATMELAASLEFVDHPGILFLGDLYAERGAYSDALRVYRRAAEQFPLESASRLIDFALALIHQDDLQEAASLLEALPQHPEEAIEIRKLHAIAQLQMERDEPLHARATLESLLSRDPLHGSALLALGRVHEKLGHPEKAAFAFEQALGDPEAAYEAHLELSRLALQSGNYEAGLAQLEQALSINTSLALREHLARIKALVQLNNES